MRCKYIFKVHGRIKPAQSIPFQVSDYLFEFCVEKKFIREIHVSFPVSDRELPSITQNPEPGVAMHINMKSPRLAEVEEIVRSIEGLWAFWGVESIDVHLPKNEWIAESDEEKKKLQLFNFSLEKNELEDHEIRPISFDLLARPIISAVKRKKHDVVLAFYRRGCNDIKKEEYIEAIYDFYFVLESAFAKGKNKNYAVEKEFLKSKDLRKHIESCRDDAELIRTLRPEDRHKYRTLLDGKSIDELIKFIVSIRGFLHHHTEKRHDIWNPEKQGRFKAEAFFLQNLCYKITLDVFMARTYDKEVIQEYEHLVKTYNSTKG
ncbi:MAG: hypothetical protein ACE5GU_07580 [Candidatus Scalinduaceae bacterium]